MVQDSKGAPRLNASEAYAGVLVAAVACDGTVTEREALELVGALSRQALFDGLPEKQMRAMLQKLGALARDLGAGALVAMAAPSVPPDLRETAFANAVDLVMADDHVTTGEADWLRKAQAALGVRDDMAARIIEVIAIKNLG